MVYGNIPPAIITLPPTLAPQNMNCIQECPSAFPPPPSSDELDVDASNNTSKEEATSGGNEQMSIIKLLEVENELRREAAIRSDERMLQNLREEWRQYCRSENPAAVSDDNKNDNDIEEGKVEEEVKWEDLTAAGCYLQFSPSTSTTPSASPGSSSGSNYAIVIPPEAKSIVDEQHAANVINALQRQLAEKEREICRKDEEICGLQENIQCGFLLGREFEREKLGREQALRDTLELQRLSNTPLLFRSHSEGSNPKMHHRQRRVSPNTVLESIDDAFSTRTASPSVEEEEAKGVVAEEETTDEDEGVVSVSDVPENNGLASARKAPTEEMEEGAINNEQQLSVPRDISPKSTSTLAIANRSDEEDVIYEGGYISSSSYEEVSRSIQGSVHSESSLERDDYYHTQVQTMMKNNELRLLRIELAVVHRSNEALQSELDTVRHDANSAADRAKKYFEENDMLRSQLGQVRAATSCALVSSMQYRDENEALREQLQRARADSTNLQMEIGRLSEDVSRANANSTRLLDELDGAKGKGDMVPLYETRVTELLEELKRRDLEVDCLKEEIGDLRVYYMAQLVNSLSDEEEEAEDDGMLFTISEEDEDEEDEENERTVENTNPDDLLWDDDDDVDVLDGPWKKEDNSDNSSGVGGDKTSAELSSPSSSGSSRGGKLTSFLQLASY